jgi:hypothetical protein
MTPHTPTIEFIRQITADGKVTEDEVYSLANYLNENREARKSWPGTAVFEVLRDVFEDGHLDRFEVEGLGHILSGVEVLCAGRADLDPPTQVPEVLTKSNEDGFLLPQIDQRVKVKPSNQFDSVQKVNLLTHECDCSDWSGTRSHLPENSPGRACKHVVRALHLLADDSPALKREWNEFLLGLVSVTADTDRGLEAVENWKILDLDGTKFLAAWGKTDWCNVYTLKPEGKMERFAYNVSTKRWSYGARPKQSALLNKFFKTTF